MPCAPRKIRRLRADDLRAWTLAKLAVKFGVHRSTISHVLRNRMRASAEQELAALRVVVETSGAIDTEQVITLKHRSGIANSSPRVTLAGNSNS